jgi:hypothetical protein
LIIECTPKQDKYDEWIVLGKLLEMTVSKNVGTRRFQSKQTLIGYLNNVKHLEQYNYIHLSGLASLELCEFKTPKGSLSAEEFPKSCFSNKTVTFSACSLGKKNFFERFTNQTSATRVIAPQREVRFVDAALWFVTFYYYVLHCGNRPQNAYDRTQVALNNLRGNFKFW